MPEKRRSYKYYDLVLAGFVTVLICSNFISSPKRVSVGGFVFGAGVVFFPISYVFGDVLTEVYGYARSRKVVWAGFGSLIFASIVSWIVLRLPPEATWDGQPAWERVFGNSPRIVAASILAYCCGEFTNSFTLAKMKIWSEGKHLWARTIGSTVVGEAIDTMIFIPAAFYGQPNWPIERIVEVMMTNYVLKVLLEVVMTPVTYAVVGFLKKAEHEDYYDRDTDFNPFTLKD